MTANTEATVIKSADIIDALRRKHQSDKWAFFPELRIGTGYGKDADQRIDAWAIHYYPSEGCKRIAYEVKVSRSDFLAEIKNPRKRAFALMMSNEFYFAAPKGLIKIEELPPECGLIELSSPGSAARTIVAAPCRDTEIMSYRFVASILRRTEEQGIRSQYELQINSREKIIAELVDLLRDIKEVDRTPVYETGEARPDGQIMRYGGKFKTPSELIDEAFSRIRISSIIQQLKI